MYPIQQLCTTLNTRPVREEKVIKVIRVHNSLLILQKAGLLVCLIAF